MTLVVVRHRSAAASFERQSRLCAIQRLDLAFLVQATHHGVLGRVETKPDDGLQLLAEPRVRTDFESLTGMRLQSTGMPDPAYGRFAHTCCGGNSARTQWVAAVGFSWVVLSTIRLDLGRGHHLRTIEESFAPTRRLLGSDP